MNFEKIKKGTLAVLKAITLAIVAVVTKELWEGQPLAGLAKLKNYRYILTSSTPFWALLLALFLIFLLIPYWWRAIRKTKPELHLAWHGSAGWGVGGLLQKDGGIERVLRIQGPVIITSSHLDDTVFVTGIELKGAVYAGPYFQLFEVKPGETLHHHLMLNFRGVKPAKGQPFKASLTVVDIKGKRYPLQPTTLRAFPGEDVPPAEPPKPKPVVNTAWRTSEWCWAQVGSQKVVRLVLEGLMQVSNIPARIIITGARVKGSATVGAFDTFPVEPDQEFYRSISLNIEDMIPEGKAPVKAEITLFDLQGNEYPLNENTFTAYDEPTRWVGGLPWPKDVQ